MTRRARFGVAAAAVLVTLAAGVYFGAPLLAKKMAAEKVVAKLQARLGEQVKIATTESSWGKVTFRGLAVGSSTAPVVTIDRMVVHYSTFSAIWGSPKIDKIQLSGIHVRLLRERDGHSNFAAIVAKLRKKNGSTQSASSGGLLPAEIVFDSGDFVYDDRMREVYARVNSGSGFAKRGASSIIDLGRVELKVGRGPRATAEVVGISAPLRGGYKLKGSPDIRIQNGSVALLSSLALTGITGRITPDVAQEGREFSIDLAGGYGGVPIQLWSARGWLRPTERSFAVTLHADKFEMNRLAPILVRTPIRNPEKSAISADMTFALAKSELTFDGGIEIHGLSVEHRRLATEPLTDMTGIGSVRGKVNLNSRRVELADAALKLNGAEMHLSGDVSLSPGAPPRGTARLRVPEIPCQKLLDAIPAGFVPALRGFQLNGQFATDIHVSIDMANIDATILGGSVGVRGCQVLDAPMELSTRRLMQSFSHHAEFAPGKWVAFDVGPSNPDFVPYDQISPHLINSLMTTEDGGFFRHRGFIPSEFRTALISNLKRGKFGYGASSITMQMVKNVMLTREKTLSRKFQELFLTHYVETTLSKERILEIYLNVIEFGPEIYGIGAAAKHYFGHPAAEITPLEAAFFSSILPNPKLRYTYRCTPELTNKWALAKVGRIVDLMHKRGRLSDQDYEAAKATKVLFNPETLGTEQECIQRSKRAVAEQAALRAAQNGSVRPPPGETPEDPPEGVDGELSGEPGTDPDEVPASNHDLGDLPEKKSGADSEEPAPPSGSSWD